MISRYEIYLNGKAISSIDSKIIITDIKYTPVPIKNSSYTLAKRNGSHVYDRYFEKSSVTIIFKIRAYSTHERQEICADIVKWAKNGGILQTSDRIGQRLRCICDAFPVVSSVRNWLEDLQIVFSAYELPFWEETLQKNLALDGTSETGTLYVPGNVDGALSEVSVTARAPLSSVSLTMNGRTLTLSGMSVSAGQTINITYDNNLIQSIKVGNSSLLNKRTGADDLIAKCGENNVVSVLASASVNAIFKVRGLWL